MATPTHLDLPTIVDALGEYACHFDVDLLQSCGSTNSELMERAEAGAPSGSVIVTREQTAGRGRRGRTWISAPGDSLAFSLLWRLPPPAQPAGLSLAAGLAVVNALTRLAASAKTGGASPRLKWPNDILLDGRKLGGILVELLPGKSPAAVIGCGLNLSLPAGMPDDLRAQSGALSETMAANQAPDPNTVLGSALVQMLHVLRRFGESGFGALQTEWMDCDAFRDHPVRVISEFSQPLDGVCRGVNCDGALRLEVDGLVQEILSGEVSLRLAS
jgi:BirA family transcriptional regulator, biotin operon repressor / biotin---[acetyl-CoA-carboxylase] ligase